MVGHVYANKGVESCLLRPIPAGSLLYVPCDWKSLPASLIRTVTRRPAEDGTATSTRNAIRR